MQNRMLRLQIIVDTIVAIEKVRLVEFTPGKWSNKETIFKRSVNNLAYSAVPMSQDEAYSNFKKERYTQSICVEFQA